MPSCLRSINISKGKKLSIRNMKQQQGHDPGLFVEKIFCWVIEVPAGLRLVYQTIEAAH